MRKFWLLLILLFAVPVSAQVVTHTPNLNLNKPCVPGDPGCAPTGHPNYGPLLNENSDIIDAKLPTLNLTCTDGQVPAWANGKFSVCASASAGSGHVIWGATAFTARSKLRFLGAGVALLDNAANDSTDVTISGTATNAVLNNQANTYTTGDQNMMAATSFAPPNATGAAPTTNFRIAGNTSTSRLVYGVGGSTFVIAHTGEIQPLSTGLTQLAALSPVNNSAIIYNGTIWTTLTRPSCSGANQALNFDATTHAEGCVTIATGGISGTSGRIAKINVGGVTAGDSIMSEAAGVVTVAGGLVVGSGASLIWNTSAITVDRTWTILDVSGTIRPATGAFVAGQFVTTNASGQLIDAGPAAGTGTWTDASVNTGTNKTLDESSNTLKITKSVQAELYAPTTANATCTGCYYFRVPVSLNGTNLVGVQSNVVTAGTTGLASVQITRCAAVATTPLCSGATASMLSTVLSIDSGETSSSTAATAAVINTANDDVATGQILRFDVTAIHTTPAQGLIVNLDFKLP